MTELEKALLAEITRMRGLVENLQAQLKAGSVAIPAPAAAKPLDLGDLLKKHHGAVRDNIPQRSVDLWPNNRPMFIGSTAQQADITC